MNKFKEVLGMMKKISIFFLALILIFSMAGCGAESDPQMSGPADHVESETDTEPTDTTGADETELTYDADMKDVTNMGMKSVLGVGYKRRLMRAL